MATRKAASLFTGDGPGAMLAFSAATPPPAKSLRQSRTVSSRTPNASAISGLVQPASVSSTAAIAAPQMLPSPPSVTMTTISIDWINPKELGELVLR